VANHAGQHLIGQQMSQSGLGAILAAMNIDAAPTEIDAKSRQVLGREKINSVEPCHLHQFDAIR
jgi:hypothetical protein